MTATRGVFVADVAWPTVAERLAAGSTAVLPIGAASKEHGYHLPLNTDYLQAEWLAREMMTRHDLTVWPTLSYGYYPVFVDYPGSISIAWEIFEALVRDILDGMLNAGARRVAILNTGISTIAPLRASIGRLRDPSQALLCNVYSGAAFTTCANTIAEQSFGGHADEIETSIMLAIAPERVALGLAVAQPHAIARGVFNRRDPAAPTYCPSGAHGDPTRATADKGRQLLAAMIEDISAALAGFLGAGS